MSKKPESNSPLVAGSPDIKEVMLYETVDAGTGGGVGWWQ
jgi:hypothetical protein